MFLLVNNEDTKIFKDSHHYHAYFKRLLTPDDNLESL